MADRFPLIIDSAEEKIKELVSGDNLDLTGNSIKNADYIQTSEANIAGIVTATKFKGDGSELDNLPPSGSSLEATATGTLADGSKVVINTDGTVSVVTQTETLGAGSGTPEVFASTSTNAARSATYDSTNNRVVVAYQDGWDSDHGKAAVGEISGTDITFGTPVKFASNGKTDKIAATFDSANSRVVIAYEDAGNSSYGTAVVGEVDPNDNSIDFGTPEVYEFATTTGGDVDTAITFDSTNGRVVIAYRDAGNSSYGTAIVGNVNPSTNAITFGTPSTFNSANTQFISATFDSSNGRVVIAYKDSDSYGRAVVGEVNPSTNAITFGSEYQFNSARSDYITTTFDASKNRVVIAFIDFTSSPSGYGTAIVGEVNTSNESITYGSKVNFNTTGSTPFSSAVYDASNNNVVISYMDNGNSAYGTAIAGTVNPNDNSIEFGSSVVFESAGSYWTSSTYTTDGKVVISYLDNGNSNYGTAVVFGQSGFSPVPQLGSASVFEQGTTDELSIVHDPSTNRIVLAYADTSNSQRGTAVVGTVDPDDRSIEFGTPVIFESSNPVGTRTSIAYDSTNDKVVIAYVAGSYNSPGTAVVGTIDPNDNSIEFGSKASFSMTAWPSVVYDPDSEGGKIIVFAMDGTDSNKGKGSIGTVNGTSISFATPVTFSSGAINAPDAVYTTGGRTVIAYQDDNNSDYGTAVVATINPSGGALTFGTPVPFHSGVISNQANITYDSDNNNVVIAYINQVGGNWAHGYAIVGTASGTLGSATISFGTPTVFESLDNGVGNKDIIYDADSQKIVIAYRYQTSPTESGKMVCGSVNGTSISFESSTTFANGIVNGPPVLGYDSTNKKVVLAYRDIGNSSYGTAKVFSPITKETNLTSENFIGISDGAYSDGQTATIQLTGAVDDAQSGLTPGQAYYVQDDGTLGESGTVFAGTAVAATKLIVKG